MEVTKDKEMENEFELKFEITIYEISVHKLLMYYNSFKQLHNLKCLETVQVFDEETKT